MLGVVAGVAWFGLLFFAGVTSSLAMGTPVMGFLKDEFGWKEKNAAWMFGGIVFLLGLPTVLFFNNGVFDEYDYWAGTVSLVIFAFIEIILFAWIFGMDRGWKEITMGADIKVPIIFKYIIKYVTPLLLGWVLYNSLPGIWDTISHKGSKEKIAFYENKEAIEKKIGEQQKKLDSFVDFNPDYLTEKYSDEKIESNRDLSVITYFTVKKQRALLKLMKDESFRKESIAAEEKTKLFKNLSRALLLGLWLIIAYFVYVAYKKRIKEGRLTV